MTTSPTRTGLLIVGASQAGVQLAISLRAPGFDGHITLASDEDHRPYQRPALSKEFLQGTYDKERLIFRSNEYWDEHDITLLKGVRVESVDKRADGSGVATAADGRTIAFDRLALAVGARARKMEAPGADLGGVLYLRNADDAHLLDSFELYNDATESSAPQLTSIDTLAEKLTPFNDENCNTDDGFKMILAINLGTLNNFIESEKGKSFSAIKKYVEA